MAAASRRASPRSHSRTRRTQYTRTKRGSHRATGRMSPSRRIKSAASGKKIRWGRSTRPPRRRTRTPREAEEYEGAKARMKTFVATLGQLGRVRLDAVRGGPQAGLRESQGKALPFRRGPKLAHPAAGPISPTRYSSWTGITRPSTWRTAPRRPSARRPRSVRGGTNG